MGKERIGVIGFGNMGSAIAERARGLFDIEVFDKDKNKDYGGFGAFRSVTDLAAHCSVILIAVKPQDIALVLSDLKPLVADKLIISVAAGVCTGYIEDTLKDARVIRVMPNMPALLGKGISCICRGRRSDNHDLELALRLFACVGDTVIIEEAMMDAATAVSGSGPAYYCFYIRKDKEYLKTKKQSFIDEFVNAACSLGFEQSVSAQLVTATVEGTRALLEQKGWTCEELIGKVASKGGTTEAALAVLDKGAGLQQAARRALARAQQLSKGGLNG